MCIAIFKPVGQSLKYGELKECWDNNSDGAGFMFADGDGKLIVRKGYMKFRSFWRAWKRQDLTDRSVAVHFRISTGGGVNVRNCHPFKINDNMAVVHNGIFTRADVPIIDAKYSDTAHFVHMLQVLNSPDFLKEEKTRKWIEKIASGSKLIFMNRDGAHEIVNEKDGEWYEGSWYSNCSYKYPVYYEYCAQYAEWECDGRGIYNTGSRKRITVIGKGKGSESTTAQTDYSDKCVYCNTPLFYDVEKEHVMCADCVAKLHWEMQEELESERVIALGHNMVETCDDTGLGSERSLTAAGESTTAYEKWKRAELDKDMLAGTGDSKW